MDICPGGGGKGKRFSLARADEKSSFLLISILLPQKNASALDRIACVENGDEVGGIVMV